MARLRRIVYASDFSGASRKAFAIALTMAKANRAALTIVHVVEPILRRLWASPRHGYAGR